MKPCVVCNRETRNKCGGCREVRYCAREHQKQDWKVGHKRTCKGGGAKGKPAGTGAALGVDFAPLMSPAASQGMSEPEKYTWFVDCYRMRLDEEYLCSGECRGLYDAQTSSFAVAKNFVLFCRLAVKHKVIPAGFDWAAALHAAGRLLPYALEVSDAQEIYKAKTMSLRTAAEMINGISCQAELHHDRPQTALEEETVVPP